MEFTPIINDEFALFMYIPNVLLPRELIELTSWLQCLEYRGGQCISGKEIPRKQLWFQESGEYFCSNWKVKYNRWESEAYEEILSKYQTKINKIVNQKLSKYQEINPTKFNSCLINKYRSGMDSIRPHRDTSESFGDYPTIAALSFGAKRTMCIKKIATECYETNSLRHDENDSYNLNIELEDNSIFIMAGASQKYFTHEIPKAPQCLNVRFSLTFRDHTNQKDYNKIK